MIWKSLGFSDGTHPGYWCNQSFKDGFLPVSLVSLYSKLLLKLGLINWLKYSYIFKYEWVDTEQNYKYL